MRKSCRLMPAMLIVCLGIMSVNSDCVLAVSPFGSNNPFASTQGNTSDYLQDLGVGWISDQLQRTSIEQMNESPDGVAFLYDFSVIDGKLGEYGEETHSNAWFVINVDSCFRFRDGKQIGDTDRYLPNGPNSRQAYESYLTSLIQYVNNKVPGWQVKYWSIDNEQAGMYFDAFGDDKNGAKKAAKAYATLVEASYNIIKSLYPDAKIVLGGPGSSTSRKEYNRFYKKVLEVLKKKGDCFDFFDYHNFNSFQKYKENAKGKDLNFFTQLLQDTGWGDKPIIIKAGATHSGMDKNGIKRLRQYQTEKEQAQHLLKRFIYHIAKGVKLILWGTIREYVFFNGDDTSFYNYTGLVYNGIPKSEDCNPEIQLPCPDPGDGIKKLSYYTFKLQMEKVDGCDWDNVQTLVGGQDNIYVYRLTKQGTGDPIWVAWWDYFDEELYSPGDSKTITLNVGSVAAVQITEAIPDAQSGADLNENDYPNFFVTQSKSVVGGEVSLLLKEIPVFVQISG
jgi:hypothetical protein